MATIPAVSMTTTLTSLLLTALSLSSLLHNGRWNKAVVSGHHCPVFSKMMVVNIHAKMYSLVLLFCTIDI